MKKFFCYFLGTIFVFLLGLMLYLAKFADEPLADFSDLEPMLTEVPAEENGFPLILAELKTLEAAPEYDDLISGTGTKADKLPLFEKLYKANPKSFELLSKAIAKPYIQESVSFDYDDEILSINLIYLTKILSEKIHYHQVNNQTSEAIETYNDLKKLSIKHLQSDGTLINHILAAALVQQILTEQFHLFEHGNLDPKQLLNDAHLREILSASYKNAMNCEWKYIGSLLDNLSGGADSGLTALSSNAIAQDFLYQPNLTKNTYSEILRLNKQLPKSNFPQRKSIENDIIDLIPKPHGFNLSSNYIGNEILGVGPSFHKSYESGYSSILLKNRVLHLLVALRNYSNDHNNALPENLSELVPQYLPSIPLDPFTEKPLHYSKKKKLIWSVGADLKDDLGVSVETLRADEQDPLKTLTFEDEPHLVIPF